ATWMYAGCNNGNVYDISEATPRLAYEIEKGDPIDWLDIRDGLLAVSTRHGKVALIDPESRIVWSHPGTSSCFTVRIDKKMVYHGNGSRVVAYDRVTGVQRWKQTVNFILFGWQTEKSMYVGGGVGVVRLSKKDGRKEMKYALGGSALSCATSPDGKYVF